MKFIKTLAGEYVRVDAVNKFVIEYDAEGQKFYVMAITAVLRQRTVAIW